MPNSLSFFYPFRMKKHNNSLSFKCREKLIVTIHLRLMRFASIIREWLGDLSMTLSIHNTHFLTKSFRDSEWIQIVSAKPFLFTIICIDVLPARMPLQMCNMCNVHYAFCIDSNIIIIKSI